MKRIFLFGFVLQLICLAVRPAAATVSLDCKGRFYLAEIELAISQPTIAGLIISQRADAMSVTAGRLQMRSSSIDFSKRTARVTGIFTDQPRIQVSLTISGLHGILIYKDRHKLVCDWDSIG